MGAQMFPHGSSTCSGTGVSHQHGDPVSASYPGFVKVFPERMRKFGSPLPKRRKTCPDNQGFFQSLSSPSMLGFWVDFGGPGTTAEDAVPAGCCLTRKTPLCVSRAAARSQPLIGVL